MSEGEGIEILWYGQSMFTVSGGGLTVCIDPTPPETGYSYAPVSAEVVLQSHDHFDHSYLDGVTGAPAVIKTAGGHEGAGVLFEGFSAFHDDQGGAQRGANVIFTWEQAGLRLAHLGDLGETPAQDVAGRLSGADVLMIPVGGVFTIDGPHAARLIAELRPRVAIPMHYKTEPCVIPLNPLSDFTGVADVPVHEVARPLRLSDRVLPTRTEVWVVPYQ